MANDRNVDRTTAGPRMADEKRESVAADRRARREQLVQERRKDRVTVKERQKRQRLINLGALGVTALVLIVVIAAVGANWWNDRQGNEALAGVVSYEYISNQHEDGELTYAESPPVGGPHNSAWQNCGYYGAPVPNWNAVHSLEHGAVWITYSPDLPQDQIDQLQARAESESYILVSPYPNQTSPVVATSWNHQIALTGADDPGLNAYVEKYRINQEFTPEPGASCTGANSGTLPL